MSNAVSVRNSAQTLLVTPHKKSVSTCRVR